MTTGKDYKTAVRECNPTGCAERKPVTSWTDIEIPTGREVFGSKKQFFGLYCPKTGLKGKFFSKTGLE